MGDVWIDLLGQVLRPARPELARCLAERSRHLAQRLELQERRALDIARCVEHIDRARREVFAADDGIVTAHMTALEREWRRLSRQDPEAGLMDLWARLVSPGWTDRKRWRDSPHARWLDALIALAADEHNARAAESAVFALRAPLAGHGVTLGSRVRFRLGEQGEPSTESLLAAARRHASERCAERRRGAAVTHAEALEQRVRTAALARFPDRPELASEIARAAFVDVAWRAAELDASENPALALHALWATGYVLAGNDGDWVTLEIPPLATS